MECRQLRHELTVVFHSTAVTELTASTLLDERKNCLSSKTLGHQIRHQQFEQLLHAVQRYKAEHKMVFVLSLSCGLKNDVMFALHHIRDISDLSDHCLVCVRHSNTKQQMSMLYTVSSAARIGR